MIVMSGRKRTRTNSGKSCVGYFEILRTPEGSATIWQQRVTNVTNQSATPFFDPFALSGKPTSRNNFIPDKSFHAGTFIAKEDRIALALANTFACDL